MSNLVEVENLVVYRGNRTVLDISHLAILQGEVLSVIGPNGAGKTTLLLVLSRLIIPNHGRITFNGLPIEDIQGLAYRRRIALVLQEPLLLDMPVFDNVAAGLRFRNTPSEKTIEIVNHWLDRLGINHLRSRPARSLSGGEAQRVSLARAFALQPELLLLDEPFSALDAPSRFHLLDELNELLTSTGITTVFITHDHDEALFLGQRIAVLLSGRLRQIGLPQEVFSAPIDEEVASFVGVETVVSGTVTSNQDGRVMVMADSLLLEAVGEVAVGRSVLFCLRPEDVTIWPAGNTPVSSARNRLTGRIVRISPQGALARLTLDCGFPLKALVTRASVQEMNLTENQLVTATFKASAVHLIPHN